LLADVSADSGIHFLPVELNQTLAQTYLPDQFKHDTYPLLIPADTTVPTIAVGDVMAMFGWQPRTERYSKVVRFVDAFFSKFDQFQQPPRHPKWREVNLTAEVPGWTRFAPAQDWLDRKTAGGTAQARLNTVLSQIKPDDTLGEAAKAELYRQFLAWKKPQTAAQSTAQTAPR
jgi:hypothetical protein